MGKKQLIQGEYTQIEVDMKMQGGWLKLEGGRQRRKCPEMLSEQEKPKVLISS